LTLTNEEQDISVPIDLSLLAAIRASNYQKYEADLISQLFVTKSYHYALADILNICYPLKELIKWRYSTLFQELSILYQKADIIIHLSGGSSTHISNLVNLDLKLNDKLSKQYVLTDLKKPIKLHKTVMSNYFRRTQQISQPTDYLEFDVFKDSLPEKLSDKGINLHTNRILIFSEGFIYYLPHNIFLDLIKQINTIISHKKGFFLTDMQFFDYFDLLNNNYNSIQHNTNRIISKLFKRLLKTIILKEPIAKKSFEQLMANNGYLIENICTISDSKNSRNQIFKKNSLAIYCFTAS
jgi:hypothetical protein